MVNEQTLVILIAPNVGEQMGGEGIKALQIFREMKILHPRTIQITHERNKAELSGRLGISEVYYIPDTIVALFLWHSRVFRWLLNPWFCRKAVKLAEMIAGQGGLTGAEAIIHQTEPNSPVMPRTVSKKHPNVFGPINGNIYYPECFRANETLSARLRRVFHMPAQRINRLLFTGVTKANLILCAGGTRTKRSLLVAGCNENIIVDSLDCGISDAILDRPRVTHVGQNLRFVHYGRLVFHKGTSLIVEALAKTQHSICLDIIGRGPELEPCRKLVEELGLGDRVQFLDWFPSHADLLDTFGQYRGVVLPSIEDANGIVVQESMAMGLPAICLNWGGPQLLIQNEISGYLIEPKSKDYIATKIAESLDKLASNGELAEKFSRAAKQAAQSWRWSKIIRTWMSLYSEYVTSDSSTVRARKFL